MLTPEQAKQRAAAGVITRARLAEARDRVLDSIERAIDGLTRSQRQRLLDMLADDLASRAGDPDGYYGKVPR